MKCQHEGCQNEGLECRLWDYGDFTSEPKLVLCHYCPEHAQREGFCWLCGEFYAGIESFNFSPSGLCANCQDAECDPDDIGELAGLFAEGL